MIAAAVAVVSGQSAPTDWPQWRGPDRSGVSRESGLLKQWPSNGPAVLWSSSNLGAGYGSIATSGDRIFVQGLRNRQSIVSALNRADGKGVWSKALGPGVDNDRGPGPRGTPTVDGDRLYVLTENGDLACLKHDGTMVWQRNILKDFGGRNIGWLISESPLVDGNHVIVTPGGRGAAMVALDKMTGKTVWTSKELSDEAGYSSPVVADVQGVRTVMTLTAEAGVGVRASDGKLMWRYRTVANNTANIATPIFFDNKVFYTSDYGTGGGAARRCSAEGGEVKAQEIYFTREMQNHHGGVVLVNGYLYGFNNSILTCLEFATGKMAGATAASARARSPTPTAISTSSARTSSSASPRRRPPAIERKDASRSATRAPGWAHPVVSGGRLYIRNQADSDKL